MPSTDPRYDGWLDAAALVGAAHLGDEAAFTNVRRSCDLALVDEALDAMVRGVIDALPVELRVILRAQLLADGLGDETIVAVQRLVELARPAGSWGDYEAPDLRPPARPKPGSWVAPCET